MNCAVRDSKHGTGGRREDEFSDNPQIEPNSSSQEQHESDGPRPPETPNRESCDEPIALAEALSKLAALLPRLADALERRSEERPRVERLTYRIEEIADALGVSRRFFERARSAGRLPKPDLRIGKVPLWRVETIRDWLDKGGRL